MTDERLREETTSTDERLREETTSTDKTGFRAKLDALIGQPTGGSGKPTVAPDPVNQAMIRHWAHSLDDMNPAYLDAEFAAKSRFGGIVSPPVMLQTWTMPAPKLEASPNAAVFRSRGAATLRRSSRKPGSLAAASPDAADGVPVHRRAGRTRRWRHALRRCAVA